MKAIVLVLAAGALSLTNGCATDSTDADLAAALGVGDLPLPGTLSSPIEGYAHYDASIDQTDICGGAHMRPGPQAFSDWLAPYGIVANTYGLCGSGFHPRGLALDVWIHGHDAKEAFASWLTANHGEMARRLGLVQIIWNHSMWRSYDGGGSRPQGAWGAYGGDNAHTDHLHLSFGEAGAQAATSFFTDVIGGGAGSGPHGHTFAFQANTGALWIGTADTGLGMMAGTSPSLASTRTGPRAAFQANTGSLWIAGTDGAIDLGLGMMASTRPSITAHGEAYLVAFQANTGSLFVGSADQGLGMASGTSPSIVTLRGGGHQIAFQANTGSLWVAGTAGTYDTGYGMMAGTSPSIAALAGGGFQVAFQANTGALFTTGTAGTVDTGLGMMRGTSPSITALASGGYQMAMQANTGALFTAGSAGTADLGLGMMTGTSPSIAARGDAYEIVFQANTSELYRTGPAGTGGLGFGMATTTSPAGN
jgi:hypothetical protein